MLIICMCNHLAHSILTGDLPISVNLRTFTPGNHTIRIIITDTVALTAQDTIEYLLENDTRPSNSEFFLHLLGCLYINKLEVTNQHRSFSHTLTTGIYLWEIIACSTYRKILL